MSSMWRANDVRGIYPDEINTGTAEKIAVACGKIFGGGRVVVAHDVRNGSIPLASAVEKGLLKANAKLHRKISVEMIGFATTPMFVYLIHTLKAVGGIMITASHNPKEYNGLKIIGKHGVPIGGAEIHKHLS